MKNPKNSRKSLWPAMLFLLVFVAASGLSAVGTGSGSSSGSSSGSNSTFNNPQTAAEWYDMGKASADAGYYTDAISQFLNAVRLKTDYAEAYNMLGFSYRKSGQLTKAFQYYETALKLRPDFEEAHEYYGEAFLQSGNLVKAMKEYIYLKNKNSDEAGDLWTSIEAFVAKNAK